MKAVITIISQQQQEQQHNQGPKSGMQYQVCLNLWKI